MINTGLGGSVVLGPANSLLLSPLMLIKGVVFAGVTIGFAHVMLEWLDAEVISIHDAVASS